VGEGENVCVGDGGAEGVILSVGEELEDGEGVGEGVRELEGEGEGEGEWVWLGEGVYVEEG